MNNLKTMRDKLNGSIPMGVDVMKNMKIPVENNLDEIVGELERLGCVKIFGGDGFGAKTIESYMDGTFDVWIQSDKYNTTLAELKEMQDASK